MKILVVEDNKKLLQTIEKEIIKHFEVKCCEDGEEALYLIKQGIYDLVVLDLMLPSLNGLEVLKNIRKDYIDTPVLILTAKESLDEKMEAFSIGANDYLTKPFYMEELVARVYAILRTTGKLKNKNVLQFKDLHVDINEKRVFINSEFENVLEKYKPYFFNIESEYIISKDQTKLEIKINFIFKDGDIKTHILNMEL